MTLYAVSNKRERRGLNRRKKKILAVDFPWHGGAPQPANGSGGNRAQRFGFCFGCTSVRWKLVALALSVVWFGSTNKTVWLGLIIVVVAQGKSAIAALCWQQTNTHRHTTLWLPIYLMVFWACTIESLPRDAVGNGFEFAGGSV